MGFAQELGSKQQMSIYQDDLSGPEIRVTLEIENFGEDPNLVTEMLGLKPSLSVRTGDERVLSSGRMSVTKHEFPRWALKAKANPQTPLNDLLQEIASQTRRSTSFGKLPLGTKVRCFITIIPGDLNPAYSIAPDTLRELGRIGAELQIRHIRVTGAPKGEEEISKESRP